MVLPFLFALLIVQPLFSSASGQETASSGQGGALLTGMLHGVELFVSTWFSEYF
jgi:hypothetical protein